MERSRRPSSPRPREGRAEPVPASSRLTLSRPRANRRRAVPLRERLPPAREVPGRVVASCGRVLRRVAPAVILAAIGGGLAGTGYYGWRFVTTSPRFALDTIAIEGAHTLGADALRARLPVALGDNIFTADLDAVEAVLAREPWIASVTVHRRLPRALEIVVRERQAAAVIELGGLYLADRDGRVFKRARLELDEGAGLPVITGLSRDAFAADATEAASSIRLALATLARWQESEARPAIGEVRVDVGHGVTLYTYDGGAAIRLGEAADDQLVARLDRFDAAWAALPDDERRRARSIHLDHDTRPDHVTVAFTR
jgi:cell division protein FtsQ